MTTATRNFGKSFRGRASRISSTTYGLAVTAVICGLLGVWLLTSSHAATSTANIQAESGSISSAASSVNDTSASGGQAVKFGSGSTGGGGGSSGSINGLLTNDASFFPIGVWLQTPESNGAKYKAIGVNTFTGLFSGVTSSNLTALNASNLVTIASQNSTALTNSLGNTVVKAWLQPDEPDNAQSNGSGGFGPCTPVSTLISNYNTWKAADSKSRPVMQGFGRGVADTSWGGRGSCTGQTSYYVSAAGAADIFAFDVYPVNEGLPLYYVAQGVTNLRGWVGSTDTSKPVWADIETTNFNNTHGPTPAQTKFEVWSAIIAGAKGITYFCHILSPTFAEAGLLQSASMSSAVSAINAQITSLATVINSGTTVSDSITSSAGSTAPISAMTKTSGGSTYILAADMRGVATTATYHPAGITSGTATVLGESRTITISGGSFSDSFAGYDVHLYKIN